MKVAAFKTGYKPIDDHCRFSMLEGETGTMVNDFRQLKLKEYYDIMNLCEDKGVMLSRKLLDRGIYLLYSLHYKPYLHRMKISIKPGCKVDMLILYITAFTYA